MTYLKKVAICGVYDSMSRDMKCLRRNVCFLEVFLQAFAKWSGRGVREKQ